VLNICGSSFKDVGKTFQVKMVERMPRVSSKQTVAKNTQISKYILTCFTISGLLHESMCYVIVSMSSLLFYNAENSTNKGKPLNE
jgi:hypothetical protein